MCFPTSPHSLVIASAETRLRSAFSRLKAMDVFAATAARRAGSASPQTRKRTHEAEGKTHSLVLHILDVNRWQMEAVMAGEIINNSVKYFRNRT